MHFKTKLCLTGLSLLFGGLSFAAAPVTSVNISTGNSGQTTQTSLASNPSQQQAQPAVNAAALLATLTPEQRITRLENQVQYLSEFNNQLQSISSEVDQLRGQNEKLNYQVQALKKQVDSLSAANQTSSVPTTTTSPSGNNVQQTQGAAVTPYTSPAVNAGNTAQTAAISTQPSAKEQAAFTQAYNQLIKQQYATATTSFNTFLTNYPNSSLIPNAHYWLGDLYLAQGQPDNASQQYRAVVNVQNADKRPDAMVKLGTILLAYGDSAHAKQLFLQVIQQYPKTTAATQAQSRLKSM